MNLLEQEKSPNHEVEEVGERRTSVLGYLLLSMMVIFILVIGQTIFSDLSEIPKRPVAPSDCVAYLNFGTNSSSSNYGIYPSNRSIPIFPIYQVHAVLAILTKSSD